MKIGTKAELTKYMHPNKRYKIEEYNPSRRSIPQNKYMHVIFHKIAEKSGHSPGEIKEILKYKYLKSYNADFSTEYIKSTHQLSKTEMKTFIENIKHFALEFFDLPIPAPNDEYIIDYAQKITF